MTEIATRDKPDLIQRIEAIGPHLEQFGVDKSRFGRVLLTEIQKNEQLLACSPPSVLAAAFKSAQLNLEPGPLGHVWFVPRRNRKRRSVECTWMLGYRGMVELARRAGIVVTVGTVNANDHFVEEGGTTPQVVHRPNLADPGGPVAWYAVATLPDGRTIHRVLTKAQVEERRGKSDAKDRGPWVEFYDAMARKTAIRALWAQLPMTAEMQDATRSDEAVLHLPSQLGQPLEAAGDDMTVEVVAQTVSGSADLEEGETGSDGWASDGQKAAILRLAKEQGMSAKQLQVALKDATGVDELDLLTDVQAGDFIDLLQTGDEPKDKPDDGDEA